MKDKRDYLEKAIEWLIFAIAVMAIITANAAVAARLLKISMPWSDEFLRAIFVAAFFCGGAIELKKKGLISISILEESIAKLKNPIFYKLLKLFQYAVTCIFSLFCTYEGLMVAVSNFRLDKRTAAMNMPAGVIMLAFAIGMALLGGYSVYAAIVSWKVGPKTENSAQDEK